MIDEALRPKTLIFLGKKKEGESLDKLMDREAKEEIEGGSQSQSKTSKEKRRDKETSKSRRHRQDEMDPNLRIMEYIYNKQKNSLIRNFLMRPTNQTINYDNLFSVCRRFFTKSNHKDNSHHETMSFLDELLSGEDLSGNKAIIVVPGIYSAGNLSYDNARQFLVEGE